MVGNVQCVLRGRSHRLHIMSDPWDVLRMALQESDKTFSEFLPWNLFVGKLHPLLEQKSRVVLNPGPRLSGSEGMLKLAEVCRVGYISSSSGRIYTKVETRWKQTIPNKQFVELFLAHLVRELESKRANLTAVATRLKKVRVAAEKLERVLPIIRTYGHAKKIKPYDLSRYDAAIAVRETLNEIQSISELELCLQNELSEKNKKAALFATLRWLGETAGFSPTSIVRDLKAIVKNQPISSIHKDLENAYSRYRLAIDAAWGSKI